MRLLQPILYVLGVLLCIYAGIMLIPMLVDLHYGHEDWKVFALSSLVTAFVGFSLYLTHRGVEMKMHIRQAFLFTALSYFTAMMFGALPFLFSEMNMSFTDAVFEVTSGLTTTGATVINGLNGAPPGILLWRALTNGMGGIGIVVFSLAVLPMMRVGGMQLFKTESSETGEKILPRTKQIAGVITGVILTLTALSAIGFWAAGMSGFDAICHALAAIATGGLSTHDNSFAFFDSAAIEIVGTVSMLAGSLPLILYYRTIRGKPFALFHDPQVTFFMRMVAIIVIIVSIWLIYNENMGFLEALRHASFNIVSVISSTGFASTDFSQWGHFPVIIFFTCFFLGGCSGSTTGGLKAYRIMISLAVIKAQFMRMLKPHGVFVVRFGNKPVPENVELSVMTFIVVFFAITLLLTIAGCFFGMDFLTSFSGVAQGMGNIGLGLSPEIGPAGNFSGISTGAKWVITLAMLMGRLELFTILILFMPRFWKG